MTNDQRIKGKINIYSDAAHGGIILGQDQRTYIFVRKDWNSFKELKANANVRFVVERNVARSIVPEEEFLN